MIAGRSMGERWARGGRENMGEYSLRFVEGFAECGMKQEWQDIAERMVCFRKRLEQQVGTHQPPGRQIIRPI